MFKPRRPVSEDEGFHTFLISFNSSIWMADMPQEQDKTGL